MWKRCVLSDGEHVIGQLGEEFVGLYAVKLWLRRGKGCGRARTSWASTPPGGNPSERPVPTHRVSLQIEEERGKHVAYHRGGHQNRPITDQHSSPNITHARVSQRLDSQIFQNALTIASSFMRATKDAKSPKSPLTKNRNT